MPDGSFGAGWFGPWSWPGAGPTRRRPRPAASLPAGRPSRPRNARTADRSGGLTWQAGAKGACRAAPMRPANHADCRNPPGHAGGGGWGDRLGVSFVGGGGVILDPGAVYLIPPWRICSPAGKSLHSACQIRRLIRHVLHPAVDALTARCPLSAKHNTSLCYLPAVDSQHVQVATPRLVSDLRVVPSGGQPPRVPVN
jgi:hypothetical protein